MFAAGRAHPDGLPRFSDYPAGANRRGELDASGGSPGRRRHDITMVGRRVSKTVKNLLRDNIFRTLALATISLSFGDAWCIDQTVLYNNACQGNVDRGLLIARDQFSAATVEVLAGEFLRNRGGVKAGSLLIGVDEQQIYQGHQGVARIEESPAQDEHTRVASEFEQRKKLGRPSGPLARVTAIRGAALLSILNNGVLSEHLLAGETDPTSYDEAGIRYKLIHLNLVTGAAASGYCQLTVYLQTRSAVSAAGFMSLMRRLQGLTGVSSIVGLLRPDPWSIGDPGFPIIPPFVGDLTFPNPLPWSQSPTLTCAFKGHNVTCSGTGFGP